VLRFKVARRYAKEELAIRHRTLFPTGPDRRVDANARWPVNNDKSVAGCGVVSSSMVTHARGQEFESLTKVSAFQRVVRGEVTGNIRHTNGSQRLTYDRMS
jgi:hypothetical protein